MDSFVFENLSFNFVLFCLKTATELKDQSEPVDSNRPVITYIDPDASTSELTTESYESESGASSSEVVVAPAGGMKVELIDTSSENSDDDDSDDDDDDSDDDDDLDESEEEESEKEESDEDDDDSDESIAAPSSEADEADEDEDEEEDEYDYETETESST